MRAMRGGGPQECFRGLSSASGDVERDADRCFVEGSEKLNALLGS
jgi:hypothetical protein